MITNLKKFLDMKM